MRVIKSCARCGKPTTRKERVDAIFARLDALEEDNKADVVEAYNHYADAFGEVQREEGGD